MLPGRPAASSQATNEPVDCRRRLLGFDDGRVRRLAAGVHDLHPGHQDAKRNVTLGKS